jgi:hypothetical protein
MLHAFVEAMKDLLDPLHRGRHGLNIVSVDIQPLPQQCRRDLDMRNRR